jgi:hypothetical protein
MKPHFQSQPLGLAVRIKEFNELVIFRMTNSSNIDTLPVLGKWHSGFRNCFHCVLAEPPSPWRLETTICRKLNELVRGVERLD